MLAFKSLCLIFACLTIGLATGQSFSSLPAGYVYYPDIQSAYKLSANELDWFSARDACNSEGARLAVIDTQSKLQHVIEARSWLDWVWTGIYRETWGSSWKSVNNGPPLSHLPWSIGSTRIVGDCVAVSGLVHGLGSSLCGTDKKYVCEIPGNRY